MIETLTHKKAEFHNVIIVDDIIPIGASERAHQCPYIDKI